MCVYMYVHALRKIIFISEMKNNIRKLNQLCYTNLIIATRSLVCWFSIFNHLVHIIHVHMSSKITAYLQKDQFVLPAIYQKLAA